MTNGDAIYYIKQLAVLSTEREMPKIEEALETAIKALSEDYAKGFQSGYKAKEYDRQGDCDGCKFIGLRYIEGAKPRCEGCCRNYADGYVAEQTENCSEKPNNCKDEPQRDCFLCKWLGEVDVCGRCRNRNLFAVADTPQTEVETMSCQECKHWIFTSRWGWFCP